jgi:glucosamine kinase
MILVADSGSTKTDWRLIDHNKNITPVSSEGLNPYFLDEGEIAAVISAKVSPLVSSPLHAVYFYGAGCGLPQKANQVKRAIDKVLPSQQGAFVTGDTLAAARSVLQDDAGICCILGTGSNGFVYDGSKITSTVPSLGYMFSDWGSGTVLGKDFLALVLQEKLPSSIKKDFDNTFRLTHVQILENVYNRPLANRFMAGFTHFIYKYAEEEVITSIIRRNFRMFFAYYVLPFPEYDTIGKVSMVGSIAYHFRKYLLEVAGKMNIEIQQVVKNPMEGLVDYHSRSLRASGVSVTS